MYLKVEMVVSGEDDDEESIEEEEKPEQRYQRYIQAAMDEVSDPDDWCNVHHRFATRDDDPEKVGTL